MSCLRIWFFEYDSSSKSKANILPELWYKQKNTRCALSPTNGQNIFEDMTWVLLLKFIIIWNCRWVAWRGWFNGGCCRYNVMFDGTLGDTCMIRPWRAHNVMASVRIIFARRARDAHVMRMPWARYVRKLTCYRRYLPRGIQCHAW